MDNKSIYKSIEITKNGSEIPILQNGKSLESRYDPQNEALKFINSYIINNLFFIVKGICGGYLLQSIIEKKPNCIIIAIENSQDDIKFLNQLKLIKKLNQNKNIYFCTLDNFSQTFIQKYIPIFFGNIKIVEQKAWCIENRETSQKIDDLIKNNLETISMDFSTQAHFGKIWQSNILNNLKISDKIPNKNLFLSKINNSLTAIVLAAGPSVDFKLDKLKEERNNYFIISTDTAYSILKKNRIKADVVISIDGQQISTNHYFTEDVDEDTIYIFDLCSNNSAVNLILNKKGKIILSYNNHPLSKLASNKFKNKFLNLYTGAGTVTIAAVDFAIKSGFKNIEIWGADFSYNNGKPYAKSTYLEQIFKNNAYKLNSFEKQNINLMMRTPLIKIDKNKYTTKVLESYKTSTELYLKQNNCNFIKENEIYKIQNFNKKQFINTNEKNNYMFSDFINEFLENKNKNVIQNITDLSEYDLALFPLISSLKILDNNKNNTSFVDLLNIAYKSLLRYN